MGLGHQRKLDQLRDTYDRVAGQDLTQLKGLLDAVAARSALFIGSGGTLAVARLAADLHQDRTGLLARATTPLELVGHRPGLDVAAVLFSASGKHQDAKIAIRELLGGGYRPAGVVTHQRATNLPGQTSLAGLYVATVDEDVGHDGFLATNSVMAMSTALIWAARPDAPTWPRPDLAVRPDVHAPLRNERWIVLTPPGQRCVAIDFETRLAETGLGQVQATDYRNFAHGRHFGLSRNSARTTVLAVVTPPYESLAEATLRLLPPDVDVLRLSSKKEWPLSCLELLAGSMHVAGQIFDLEGLDASRPGVPEFGRKLYRLPLKRLLAAPADDPVQRKLAALATPGLSSEAEQAYVHGLDRWLARRSETRIGAVVLDYDGTVCATADRFAERPLEAVEQELLRLLDGGLLLGFASGRGPSLHRNLQSWVPKRHWEHVHLGLYNGGLRLRLVDAVPDREVLAEPMSIAEERLASTPLGEVLRLEVRPEQVSVSATGAMREGALARLVEETIRRPPRLDLQVVASAHSVDVIPVASSKVSVVREIENLIADAEVLVIGDQGQLGGNDFDLLAAVESSLSVDRCSADPTRCWRLGGAGERGPQLLVGYLRALRVSDGQARFDWRLS